MDHSARWVRVKSSSIYHLSTGIERISGENVYHTACGRYLSAFETYQHGIPTIFACAQCRRKLNKSVYDEEG